MAQTPIRLIVGLANPGPEYANTRHNAGAWFVSAIANQYSTSLRAENKFHGLTGRFNCEGHECRLLIPTTFMNHSGRAIKALASYYKLLPEEILVAHDELDMPPGTVRLKYDGGHGGHNGLRDTIQQLGGRNFLRLRLGIGHPGHSDKVTPFVLGTPSRTEQTKIEQAIKESITIIPELLTGKIDQATQWLHTN